MFAPSRSRWHSVRGETPSVDAMNRSIRFAVPRVLLFWVGYLALTLLIGFLTSHGIGSEVWQLIAWGLLSSAGLLALSRWMQRSEKGLGTDLDDSSSPSSLRRFAFGVILGLASFGVHVLVVSGFAGPIHFERVAGVGAGAAMVYFVRFLATSCMEEIGFRGYPVKRLQRAMGIWPTVFVTAVAFGLSHLSYGWDMQTITLGVIPGGLLWGMSAIATRGLAVPIGLHAAWNFSAWCVGDRAETGLLRMVVEEDAQRSTLVGTVSYLSIFGVLTVAFWWVHRRNGLRP